MRILTVSSSDGDGGAARAAYRQHQGLLTAGIESTMLVQTKRTTDYTVIGPTSMKEKVLGAVRPHIDQLPLRFYQTIPEVYFSPAWLSFGTLVDKINRLEPDIVHLHWVCKGMLTVEDIAKIASPIVWTLHDTWAFTGGCHYIHQCEKYLNECNACPVLRSGRRHDLSQRIFQRKKRSYSKLGRVAIVTVSKWLESCARNSFLMSGMDISTIPNPINTTLYKPIDKLTAKSILNIGHDRKVILFGALSAIDDRYKGYRELIEAINKLQLNLDEIELVVFGSSQPRDAIPLRYRTSYFGHLFDDVSLQILYSAADVMVVPSRQESFGQTASESMSCGTPVVAFGTSGLLDIVDHKVNGYLASPYDTSDLARGIEWVLGNPNYSDLSKNAREKVLRYFDSKIVSNAFVSLYQSVLANN